MAPTSAEMQSLREKVEALRCGEHAVCACGGEHMLIRRREVLALIAELEETR